MSDYIKRDEAVEKLRHLRDKCGNEEMAFALNWGASLVQKMFGADVRENKHGEWIKLDMHRGMEQYKCSSCGESCYVPECMGEPMYAYCPNCGAQILGENDDI